MNLPQRAKIHGGSCEEGKGGLAHRGSACLSSLDFFFFSLFGAAPETSGGFQTRGWIRAGATGLCHSHSNARSKPCLQPTPPCTALTWHRSVWMRDGWSTGSHSGKKKLDNQWQLSGQGEGPSMGPPSSPFTRAWRRMRKRRQREH